MSAEKRVSLLPHHFKDFCTFYAISNGRDEIQDTRDVLETGVRAHSAKIKIGVCSSELAIRIPPNHPLHDKYGGWIPYPEDVYGDQMGVVSQQTHSAFKEFFLGDPNEKIYVGISKDNICDSCVFGFHCNEGLKNRLKGKSDDNLSLESIYAWSQLAQLIPDDLEAKSRDMDMNLRIWLGEVSEFKKLIEEGDIEFQIENNRVQSIGIKRGVLTANIRQLPIFFSPPGLMLLWNTRERNLLTKMKGIMDDQVIEAALDIVAPIEFLDKKIKFQT